MIAAVVPDPSLGSADRPQPVDESELRQLCVLVARGCSIKEAARYVGCRLSAIRQEREANEWFRRKLARAKMKADLAPLRAMQRAMLKDWRAAAWFLERTQPEKFGRRNHRAFTQKQANALVKDITSIVGEELTSGPLIDRLSSRIEAAVRYACHAHNDMNRTAAEMGRAMKHHDMKSPRYSPTLAYPDFVDPKLNATPRSTPPTSPPKSPLASGASEFTRRGENLPPTKPATPTGRTIAQSIVDSVDKQFAATRNTASPPAAPPPNPRPATHTEELLTGVT